MTSPAPRVAVLWKESSGYFESCIAALRGAGAEVLFVARAPSGRAPFAERHPSGAPDWCWEGPAPDRDRLAAAVERFTPDALLICSWDVDAYRAVARRWSGRATRVLCMDNPWYATPRQVGGVALFRTAWRDVYDIAFVPGDRQADLARRFGFPAHRIWWGLYSADVDAYAAAAADHDGARRGFLFVGRLVHDKAVDVLVDAYRRYRRRARHPWPLTVVGTGPLAEVAGDVEGVEVVGFVQPSRLPARFAAAGCLVLPSRREHWGVVVHEAAAAGLPVIVSDACGASARLALDGYNGRVVAAGHAAGLAGAMEAVACAPDHEWQAMSRASQRLSRQFTPGRWARTVLDGIGREREGVR